ncbi:MAG TPA: GAF domain-containing protein [Atribacteraceae bacterium]|nr:GAF domain-containing protein [Atribacteraceae bacterium]
MRNCPILPDNFRKKLILDLLKLALRAFQAETGMIAVTSEGNQLMRVLAQIGLSKKIGDNYCLPLNGGIAEYVIRTKTALLIDEAHPPPIDLAYRRSRDRCSCCLPLRDPAAGSTVGVMTLNKRKGNFEDSQLPLLEVVATQIAIIIEEMKLRRIREKTIETLNSASRVYQNIKVTTSFDKAYTGILQAASTVAEATQALIIRQTTYRHLRITTATTREGIDLSVEEKRAVMEALRAGKDTSSIRILDPSPVFSALFRDFQDQFIIACPIPSYDIHRHWGTLLLLTPLHPDEMTFLSLQVVVNLAEGILENIRLLQRNERLTALQERVSLAREIHDGLTQSLISLRMQAEYLSEVASRQEGMLPVEVFSDRFIRTLTACIEESRQILSSLRKGESSPGQIKEMMEKTLRNWSRGKPLDYTFHTTINESRLPVALKRTVMNILREIIVNAGKHSGATRLRVKICQLSGWIYLLVKDNGKGFDMEQVRATKPCYGLLGMEERVKNHRGLIRIASVVDRGTTIKIGLPLI